MELLVWILAAIILICVVVAFYAAWEVSFHSRNVQLILSGGEPREHQGYTRTICERFMGKKR